MENEKTRLLNTDLTNVNSSEINEEYSKEDTNKIIQYRESHPKCRYCKYCDYKKLYGYRDYIYYCKIKATQVTGCLGGFCKLYEYSIEDLK